MNYHKHQPFLSKKIQLLFSVGAPIIAVAILFWATGCGDSTSQSAGETGTTAPTVSPGIHALTQVSASAGTGYFEDPLPVHLAQTHGSYIPTIVGTTHEALTCLTLASGCYTPTTMTILTGTSVSSLLPPNTTIGGYQNNNAYQDNSGHWQMATTVTVTNTTANPGGLPWNVILHASPAAGTLVDGNGVPLNWISDALLIGSLTTQAPANYDGKFIEDNQELYLIYSMNLQQSPTSQDGIVAQLMTSATQVGAAHPVTLLAPENNADGGYRSELFDCQLPNDQFKLIETGNITVVDGKYAMAYSSGSYETQCYKVGIAWSDSLLGPYKKILKQDSSNVWNNSTAEAEVVYLIQSLEPSWPNYLASTVQGPGVPSLVEYPAGTWYLYFAGYDPSVPLNAGQFNPKLRQPYLMKLSVNVPSNATVSGTAAAGLQAWITAATQ